MQYSTVIHDYLCHGKLTFKDVMVWLSYQWKCKLDYTEVCWLPEQTGSYRSSTGTMLVDNSTGTPAQSTKH